MACRNRCVEQCGFQIICPISDCMRPKQETVQAKYHRLIHAWTPRLLLNPQNPGAGPWLQGHHDKQLRRWAVGCVACKAAGLPGAWARQDIKSVQSLQLSHMLRHAASPNHARAVQEYLGVPAEQPGVPTAMEFRLVIEDRKTGISLNAGRPQVGSRENAHA